MDILKIPNSLFFEEVRNILASGQSVTIRATGRSMTPTFIDAVDSVIVSRCDYRSIEVGDVVLFDRGDTICLHRVIDIKDDTLIIRGDGNAHSAIEYATSDKVIGKVTGGTMKGGHPFTVYDNRWKRNTCFVLGFHLPVSILIRLTALLKSYPFSALAMFLLLFLSFFNPGNTDLPNLPNSDKIAHLIMYCGLSSVFWFEWLKRRILDKRAVILGWVYCFFVPVILGGLIELGQHFLVTYRNGDWLDFLANTAGCLLAVAITRFITVPLIKKFKLSKVYGKKIDC